MDILNTYWGYAGLGLVGGFFGVYLIALSHGYWDPFKALNLYAFLALEHPVLLFEVWIIQILGGYLGGTFTRKTWVAAIGGCLLTIIFASILLIPLWF